eukprot:CAMPEP_0198586782 /NCGR_PEP_ID=MMETSP1462-20131121/131033_1 /TAXON_ID=1333877 /ORGANISM="Brandtodinium nutriculum, Strain RCC3387" /LENGTH=137 /DNA_ID=CAMNT_0044318243 /DNA_START=72 /DNA_END=483 /DNA_ORIENTATION=+
MREHDRDVIGGRVDIMRGHSPRVPVVTLRQVATLEWHAARGLVWALDKLVARGVRVNAQPAAGVGRGLNLFPRAVGQVAEVCERRDATDIALECLHCVARCLSAATWPGKDRLTTPGASANPTDALADRRNKGSTFT